MALSAFAPVCLPALQFPSSSRPQGKRVDLPSGASGSRHPPSIQGAGVVLQQGVLTTIKSHAQHELLFNGEPVRFHPAPSPSSPAGSLSSILSSFQPHADAMPWQICQTTALPLALGAPLAAASALSLALALNQWHENLYSEKRLLKIVKNSLATYPSPLLSFEGGLLYSSGRSLARHSLSPAELRTTIRLTVFSPNPSPARPSKKSMQAARRSSPRATLAAKKALRLLRAKPHLLSLAFASRHYALENGLSEWARPLLEPRPTAGVVGGRRILFELGMSSPSAPVLLRSNRRTGAASRSPPQVCIVHPSNQGARISNDAAAGKTIPISSARFSASSPTMTF